MTLTTTKAAFDALKLEQDAEQEFAEKVELLLAGKKLGKKIKFTKKEKAVLKADKKAAKKIARAEKKIAKDEKEQAKRQAKTTAKMLTVTVDDNQLNTLDDTVVVGTPAVQEKPAAKETPAKKSPVKKPTINRAAPASKVINPIVEEKLVEMPIVADVAPEPVKEELVEVAISPAPETTAVEAPINTDVDQRNNASIESLDPNADA